MRLPATLSALSLATALLLQTAAPAIAAPPLPAPVQALPAAAPLGDPVEEVIRLALEDQRVDAASAIIEITASSPRPPLAPGVQLGIERFSYQPLGRRFNAVLTAVAAPGAMTQRFTVAGRVRLEIEIPVLARRMAAGEVISEADLQWMSVGDRRVPSNAVLDAAEIVGLTPRRVLPPGRPLVAGDLKQPTAVSKGAPVMLVLRSPSLQLTARGRALEDGAVGQYVRVANAQSRTVVAGLVLPNGQVAIDAGGFAPMMEARR